VRGAQVAPSLLVADQREDHVACQRQLRRGRPQRCGDEHRHAALHIERAPAPDGAVGELAGEGRMRPALAGRGHNVDMAFQQQRRRVAAARKPRHETRPPRIRRDERDLQAGVPQKTGKPLQARALGPGRIRRVETHQPLQQLGGPFVEIAGLGHHSTR